MANDLSSADFERVVHALTADLQLAHAQYKIYHVLRQATNQELRFVSDCHDLIWFMLNAHRDAAVLHLCRLYDSDKKAVSLSTLIRLSPVTMTQVRRGADLTRVSPQSDDVKRLLTIRHNLFAHRSPAAVRQGADVMLRASDLPAKTVRLLLKDATALVKDYSGSRYMFQQIPKDESQALRQLSALFRFMDNATFDGVRFYREKICLDGAVGLR